MSVTNNIGQSDYSDILTVVFAEVPAAPQVPTFVTRSGGDLSIGLTPYV
jgi:hypothetical protein